MIHKGLTGEEMEEHEYSDLKPIVCDECGKPATLECDDCGATVCWDDQFEHCCCD